MSPEQEGPPELLTDYFLAIYGQELGIELDPLPLNYGEETENAERSTWSRILERAKTTDWAVITRPRVPSLVMRLQAASDHRARIQLELYGQIPSDKEDTDDEMLLAYVERPLRGYRFHFLRPDRQFVEDHTEGSSEKMLFAELVTEILKQFKNR